jgi:hypothetical protein
MGVISETNGSSVIPVHPLMRRREQIVSNFFRCFFLRHRSANADRTAWNSCSSSDTSGEPWLVGIFKLSADKIPFRRSPQASVIIELSALRIGPLGFRDLLFLSFCLLGRPKLVCGEAWLK